MQPHVFFFFREGFGRKCPLIDIKSIELVGPTYDTQAINEDIDSEVDGIQLKQIGKMRV